MPTTVVWVIGSSLLLAVVALAEEIWRRRALALERWLEDDGVDGELR